jgi:hypothetical protein
MEYELKKPRGLNPQSPEVIDLRRDRGLAQKTDANTRRPKRLTEKRKDQTYRFDGEFFPQPSPRLPATLNADWL